MTTTQKVDKIIQEKGISRRKLAIMANIAPSSLQSALERGNTLSVEMLLKISEVLGVYFLDLLDDTLEIDYARQWVEEQEKNFGPLYFAMIQCFNGLNTEGQKKALQYLQDLIKISEYKANH